ncbi:MAG: hypothetical protein AAFV43_06900 [Planctomycetota bacterium]
MLRREYVDAVEAVALNWVSWATLVAPAAIAWCGGAVAAISPRRRAVVAVGAWLLATAVFAVLRVTHINAIWAAKAAHMQTEAEQMDYASDVAVSFAPILQPLVGAMYAAVHSGVAFAVALVLLSLLGTKRNAAEFMQ